MAKRNDFSVNNPKMSDYYESRAIRAKSTTLSYPFQQSLFGFETGRIQKEEGIKVKLGNFYERFTRRLYGGEMKVQRNFDCSNDSLESIATSEPDVTSRKYFRESKGVNRNECLKLIDNQMAKYIHLNNQKHGKEIRYDIFRHAVDKLEKNYSHLPLENLVTDLGKKTLYGLSLPLSVIFHIYAATSDLTSRYDGPRYATLTRFKSKAINSIILNPEETLTEFGLNPEDYIIRKTKVSKGLKVNKSSITQFPILIIEDKNPELANAQIQERVSNCVGLPTNFVLEYAKMAKDESYIKEHYDKLDPNLIGAIQSSGSNAEGLIGSLFEDEKSFDDTYWLKGLEEADFEPSDEEVPF